jgi:signal transduction histidine kinase
MPSAAPAVVPFPAGANTGRINMWASVVATLAATGIAAAVAATGTADHPAAVAAARAVIVGVPIAVGLHARYRRPYERFGTLLIALGAGWFVTTLAESSDAALYTAGRTAGWLVEVLTVAALLAFPTGRLEAWVDRALVAVMALVVLVFFVPRLALDPSFPVPSPFTSCTAGCPANALFALDAPPGIVDRVLAPLGAALTFGVLLSVAVRLAHRVRTATPLARRMFTPVFALAAAQAVLTGVGIVVRQAAPTAWPLPTVAWLLAFAVPALSLAFLLAYVRWRLVTGRALERLALCLRSAPDGATLRRAFAEAFGDPQLQIAFPVAGDDDRWLDVFGQPLAMPAPGTGRSVTEVLHDGSLIAALVHDPVVRDQPGMLDAGVAIAGVALDINRLAAQAEAAENELKLSRARIAASAERERRRIERDLHDGAQQRLVALRIELELAEGLVRQDPEGGVTRLRHLESEVDAALEEIRLLAHGMYPSLLADRGLVEALRAAAGRSAIPVELTTRGVGRYAPELESAVYFGIREALQNAAKHALGARRVIVSLDGTKAGELRFSVRDDGAGAPVGLIHPGAGITNMQDRLAAVGGELWVTSSPGLGTVVRGWAPTTPLGDPTAAPAT